MTETVDRIMQERNISTEKLAQMAGISIISARRIRRGEGSCMDTVRKVADALGISVRKVLQRPISRFVIVTEGHGTILCRVSKGNIVAGQEVTLWHDKEEHNGEAVCSDFPMYEMERVKSVCKHFGTTYFKLPCAMAKEKKNGAAEEEKQQDGDGDVRERERENHADAVHGGGGAADQ